MVYQIGTIRSLLTGVYRGDMRFDELAHYGDFGLGTFDRVNGEMVAINGRFYRIDSEGRARGVDPHLKTPFSVVTHFHPSSKYEVGQFQDYLSLQTHLEKHLESQNIIYAVCIKGRFVRVDLRSEHPQTQDGKPFVETISQLQTTFSFEQIDGSLIGFWFPTYMQAINVPGFHFHFLDVSQQSGGHLFDVQLDRATLEIMPLYDFGMHLMHTPLFEHANLNANDSSATETAERKKEN